MKKSLTLILAGMFSSFVLFAGNNPDTPVNEGAATEAGDEQVEASTFSIDIEAGKALYKKTCKNCHGPTAKGMASFPKLVDKDAAYLIDRLTQYRAGEQLGPNTPLMAPQAVKLSDEDIANISHYITSLSQ